MASDHNQIWGDLGKHKTGNHCSWTWPRRDHFSTSLSTYSVVEHHCWPWVWYSWLLSHSGTQSWREQEWPQIVYLHYLTIYAPTNSTILYSWRKLWSGNNFYQKNFIMWHFDCLFLQSSWGHHAFYSTMFKIVDSSRNVAHHTPLSIYSSQSHNYWCVFERTFQERQSWVLMGSYCHYSKRPK